MKLPKLLWADNQGRIHEHSSLTMMIQVGDSWKLPEPNELEPLPQESELFLLPGRHAVGFNSYTNKPEILPGLAVAAFAAPAHTLAGHPAYAQENGAPVLPLFAYCAVGSLRGKYWICAKKVDNDRRQQFKNIPDHKISLNAHRLLKTYPQNRLVRHIINNCALRYDCPAARNFALGRFEAPLPTSQICNARCLGCISQPNPDTPYKITPQCRMDFMPEASEIAEVMQIHEKREKSAPVYSFGQGCEGDPLMNGRLIKESIKLFRRLRLKGIGGEGTVNCNTNASKPDIVEDLASAGLTSMRVSLNSAQPELYEAYYRPINYNFEQVRQSIKIARKAGVFVSLNLLYFPGITDTKAELESLINLCAQNGVEFIQLRNLNIDPVWYWQTIRPHLPADIGKDAIYKPLGLQNFMQELQKACPWLRFGYFNPFLGVKAQLNSPTPE